MKGRRRAVAACVLALSCPTLPLPAFAAEAEARDVAAAANGPPSRVEEVRRTVGNAGETVYRVECAGTDGLSVLVQCRMRQCVLLR
jgi:hypothetical protein